MNNIKAQLKKYLQLIIGKTKEVREDGNALIFLVFLFLSACFWMLNALQKDDYTTEVNFPVRFVNVSDNELVKGSLKRDLVLKIKGGGFKILPYHLRQQFSTSSIDVSQLQRVSINGIDGAYINASDHYKLIEGKLAVGLELVSISPDTLFIPIIEKKSKKLPVKVVAQFDFDQQCQLSGDILVNPDSVVVTGAESVLDSLEYVSTKAMVFEKLKDTIVRNIVLEKSSNVELAHKRVNVTIPVEPFTEANVNVPIKAINLPDSLVLKAFPSDVKVAYHLGLSRPLFKSSDFIAIIDFSLIDINDLPRRLKVKINTFPQEINSMSYHPVFIEYLLERKE